MSEFEEQPVSDSLRQPNYLMALSVCHFVFAALMMVRTVLVIQDAVSLSGTLHRPHETAWSLVVYGAICLVWIACLALSAVFLRHVRHRKFSIAVAAISSFSIAGILLGVVTLILLLKKRARADYSAFAKARMVATPSLA